MRNLFVCHTQLHLILAVGLAEGRFSGDTNNLILFKDFMIQPATEQVLLQVFDKVLFRDGIYPAVNKTWKAKISAIPNDIKAVDEFISESYNKVFLVCDGNVQEMRVLKKAFSFNPSVEFIWLEDGIYPYFINTDKVDGLNSNDITRFLRKFAFKTFFRLGRFYDFEGNYMSANRNLKTAYLTLKGYERDIFKDKKIEGITVEEYRAGLNSLFGGQNMPLNDKSIIFVLDKLDTYADLSKVSGIVGKIFNFAREAGITVYFKYHPRDEDRLEFLDGAQELDKNLAIEYYYKSNFDKNIGIVGIKSSGVISAYFLGFKAISLALMLQEGDDNMLKFFQNIGICVPNDLNDAETYLKTSMAV